MTGTCPLIYPNFFSLSFRQFSCSYSFCISVIQTNRTKETNVYLQRQAGGQKTTISARIASKTSWCRRVTRRRHIYSHMYESNIVLCVPLCRLLCCFVALRERSMCCVWAPVFGSTKFKEWFTVACWKPAPGIPTMPLYAGHWLDIIVVPGLILSEIIGSRVAADLSGTVNIKLSPDSRHTAENPLLRHNTSHVVLVPTEEALVDLHGCVGTSDDSGIHQ